LSTYVGELDEIAAVVAAAARELVGLLRIDLNHSTKGILQWQHISEKL
jgi:hypothetical protein